MKNKFLFSLVLTAGLLFGNFSTNQVYSQAPPQNKPVKQQTVKYTCPMHPEIIKDKPGKCPICEMTLVVKKGTMKGGMKNDSAMMKHDHTKMMRDSIPMKKGHMMHDTTSMKRNKMRM